MIIKYRLLLTYFFFFLIWGPSHSNAVQLADESSWVQSECSGKVLSLVQLPRNEYLEGSIVEVVEEIFGPVLYFRNTSSCSYFFGIPLPFSICSLTYVDGHFYAIRDDGEEGAPTLYTISDTQLIGAYVYWHHKAEEQCKQCNPDERPIYFDFNDWQETCSVPNNSNQTLCSYDLDILLVKERLSLPIDWLRTSGYGKYQALMEKFQSDYEAQLSTSFEDTVWKWMQWTAYSSTPNQFTTVDAWSSRGKLLVNQRNFVPLQINDFNSIPDDIPTESAQHPYLVLTAFDYYSQVIIGIEIDGSVYMVILPSGRRVKIGKFPHLYKSLFILDDFTTMAVDMYDDVYISTDFVPDILIPLIPCEHLNGKCLFSISIPIPFTKEVAEDACQVKDGVYEEGKATELSTNGTMLRYEETNGVRVTCTTKFEVLVYDVNVVACPQCSSDIGDVKGTTGIYDQSSTLCLSAVHAGRITNSGGTFTVYHQQINAELTGTTQNGISSQTIGSESTYSFVADPSPPSQLHSCPLVPPAFLRRCGPTSGIDDSLCLSQGCCIHDYGLDHPRCYQEPPAGYAITPDKWLRSPYSSYEYAVIFDKVGGFGGCRTQCQDLGGDLAYVGVSEVDSWGYVMDNILNDVSDYAWVGLVDLYRNGTYFRLDGKKPDHIDWHPGEPNGPFEHCVMVVLNQAIDIGCSAAIAHAGLCQRISYKCNTAVESRVECGAEIPSTASRSLCLAHGCCYDEAISGETTCFRPEPDATYLRSTSTGCSWWQSDLNDYEYCVTEVNGDWVKARMICQDQGGVLAYKGFGNTTVYNSIYENVVYPAGLANYVWGGYLDSSFVLYGLDGEELLWNNYGNGHPTRTNGCLRICDTINPKKWCTGSCTNIQGVVCQRPKVPQQSNKAAIVCEKNEDNVDICDKYRQTCPDNSSCAVIDDWFECICDGGYLKHGDTCVQLPSCSPPWIPTTTGCYYAQVSVASFYEAEQRCQELGAHLISIHSSEEYQNFKDVLSPYTGGLLFWIGLRRSIPWLSKNGEGMGGCGLWTDGTKCDFHDIGSISVLRHECFAYGGISWSQEPCALSLKHVTSQINGFVCKKPILDPNHVTFTLASFDWSFYPGGSGIQVNEKEVLQNDALYEAPSASEVGSVYVITFTSSGQSLQKHRINSSSQFQSQIQSPGTFMTDVKETYFALTSAGNVEFELWSAVKDFLKTMNIIVAPAILHSIVEERNVNAGEDLRESALPNDKLIYECGDNDYAVFLDDDKEVTCRSYSSDVPTPAYQVEILKSVTKSRPSISFRSETLKTQVSSSTLRCPWKTTGLKFGGVKISSTKVNSNDKTSEVRCDTPPCVHQVACQRPTIIYKNESSDIFNNYALLCKKLTPNKYDCTINEARGYADGPLKVSATQSVISTPALATFDDLLQLGSPPFEFASVYGEHEISWRPLLWSWTSDKYATLVTGIRNKAIRFSDSEEVSTSSDVCWRNVADNDDVCPQSGITISFWIRVMQRPTHNHQFVLNTVPQGMDCSAFGYGSTRQNCLSDATEDECYVQGCLWCPSNEPGVPWCIYPPSMECVTSPVQDNGASYRGRIAKTRSGRTCQQWSEQQPHPHGKTPGNFPHSGLESNFCRNPDGEAGPWCYTTDPDHRFELCDIPHCPNDRCLSCNSCTTKVECGPDGISEGDCYASGCLWCPSDEAGASWCIVPYGGAWGSGGSRKGLGVYLEAGNANSLVIMAQLSDQYIFKKHTITLQKWTHVWFTWNSSDSSLGSRMDWLQPPTNTSTSQKHIICSNDLDVTCDSSRLSIGSTLSNGGTFDIDDLQIFSEVLSGEELRSKMLDPPLPLRFYINGTEDTGNAEQIREGELCSKNSGYRFCGRFEKTCPGSILYCSSGFNLAFTITLPSSTPDHRHLMLVSNLPPEAQHNNMNFLSFGFRIYAAYESSSKWKIYLENFIDAEFNYDVQLTWLLTRGYVYSIWVQYHPDGMWILCVRHPTNCKTGISTAFNQMSNSSYATQETFYELQVGPTLYDFTGNSYTSSHFPTASLTNVWFVSEGFDLLMFADEINRVSSPLHWKPHEDSIATGQGHTFKVKGVRSKVTFGYDAAIGRRMSISNSYSDVESQLEEGYKVEKLVGWLEMDAESSESCLFDVDQCIDGFTIQFQLKTGECHTKVSGGDCYYISSAGDDYIVSRGFAFYYSPSDNLYHAGVTDSRRKMEIKFEADFTYFVLVRIFWHPDKDFRLYLNDIPAFQTGKTERIVNMTTSTYNFNPFRGIAIGKRIDFQRGFSTFEIGDIQFWDKYVWGTPFQSIGSKCVSPWFQIGESCYLIVDNNSPIPSSGTQCSELYSASLAHVPSLPAYQAFKRLIFNAVPSGKTYFVGLNKVKNERKLSWSGLSMEVSDWSFSAVINDVENDQYTEEMRLYLQTQTIQRNEITFNYGASSADGYICAAPLVIDPFDNGCYTPSSESNKYGYDEANFVTLHRYSSSSTSASVSQLGTYDIPSACRRYCFTTDKSTLSVVALYKCHCLNADTTMAEFLANTQTLSHETNCINPPNLFSNNLQLGFSTMNFDPNYEQNLPIRPHHCNSFDEKGMYKCGTNKDGVIRAMVYGFTDLEEISRTYSNLPEMDLKVDDDVVVDADFVRSFALFQTITISVVYPFCSLPCYLSEDESKCLCDNFPVWIKATFGDGSDYETYVTSFDQTGLIFQHYYNLTGDYTVQFTSRISLTVFQSKIATLRIFGEAKQVIPNYIEAELSTPNQEIDVTLAVFLGTDFSCIINYGDDTLVENYQYSNVDAITTLKHRFREPGLFTITADCSNAIRSESVSNVALVQDFARGLRAPVDNAISHDDVYEHRWELIQGSHATCKLFFGNRSIEEVSSIPDSNNPGNGSYYFNRDTNEGVALLPIPDNEMHGIYSVVVACYNALTDTVPFAISYLSFETPVDGVDLNNLGSDSYYEENQDVALSFTVSRGSNFLVYWHWNDIEGGRDDVIEYCYQEECKSRQPCIAYEKENDYSVDVDIFDIFGMKSYQVILHVEKPIDNALINLKPGLTSNEASEVSIEFEEGFRKGDLDVDFGDGTMISERLYFTESQPTTTVQHKYTRIGIYSIQVMLSNNISSFSFSDDLQVGTTLRGLTLSLSSSRILRSELDRAVYHVKILEGSDPQYTLEFDDDKPSATFYEKPTRVGPDFPDLHYIEHIYEVPGNYVASLNVGNIFGNTQVISNDSVIVQNPLGTKFVLIPEHLEPVPFPPGSVTFDAQLIKNESYPFQISESVPSSGWANNVQAQWLISKSEGNVSIQQSFGEHDIDIFPVNLSFGEQEIGDVTVFAELSNLVSEITLKYNFTLTEKIEDLQVQVESSYSGLINLDQSWLDAAEEEELKFIITVEAGSHVQYFIDFGDGSSDTQPSPVLLAKEFVVIFNHQYKSNGVYNVTVKAENPIHSVVRFHPQSINVFEKVDNLINTVKDLNYDEELYGVSIFEGQSEIFAILFGSDAAKGADDFYYMILNRPIALHVGALNASNASITWDFVTSNTKVIVENVNGSNSARISNSSSDDVYVDASETTDNGDIKVKALKGLTPDQLQLYGRSLASKLDPRQYRAESSLLVQFMDVGEHLLHVTVANTISSLSISIRINVQAPITGMAFSSFSPPVANKTSNISFTAAEMGTESCYVIDPGDLSYEIAFGFNKTYCTEVRGVNPSYFFSLTEDKNLYAAKNFSSYSINGDLGKGNGQLNFTFQHIYVYAQSFKIRLSAFNRVSHVKTSVVVRVTEVLCEYPIVKIEKHRQNSISKPRIAFSFLKLSLYTSIGINCKITSLTNMNWYAYEMIETAAIPDDHEEDQYVTLPESASEFSSKFYKFKRVPGLTYTSYSEDITLQSRFLKLGLNLICVNVAMRNVDGLNATDCIYVQVTLPPIVAGIDYGIGRSVHHGDVVLMDALSASYDPDVQTLADIKDPSNNNGSSKLDFQMSCPFLVQPETTDQANSIERFLMFESNIDANNTEGFEFVSSNTSCVSSGYYPMREGRSTAACFSIISMPEETCGSLEINSSLLQTNESYMVRVQVSGSRSRKSISSQVIQFYVSTNLKLRINCKINCGIKINPNTSIVIDVEQIIEEHDETMNSSSPTSYTWKVLEVVDNRRKRRTLESTDGVALEEMDFESHAATGIHDVNLVLLPGLLQPSIKYVIRAIGNVGNAKGFTEIELSVNLPPYGGDCAISPEEGVALNQTFTITCLDWKDEGINADRETYISPNEYVLGYQVFYQTNEAAVPALLSYGSSDIITDLLLPPGLEDNDFRVWIQIRILDEYGAQAMVNLTARVYEEMLTDVSAGTCLNLPTGTSLSGQSLQNTTLEKVATSSAQNIARLAASVSGILNAKASNSTNNASNVTNANHTETQARASIRGKLVTAIVEKLNPEADLDGLKQTCGAMGSLTTVPDEIDDDTQLVVVDTLFGRTDRLAKLSETSASEDIEQTATVMTAGLDNVVQSARSVAVKNSTVTSSHSSLVSLPVFSLPKEEKHSEHDILDEEEAYLSPEERVERRKQKQQIKIDAHNKVTNQTMNVGKKAVSAVSSISDSVIKRKVPGEPVVNVQTNGLKVEAQRNSASQLCEMLSQNKTVNTTASTLATLLLGSNVELGDCNATSSQETVDAEYVNFNDNPFIWDGSADNVRSSVVSLSFKFPNGTSPYQRSNNSFRIELPVTPTLAQVAPEMFSFTPSGNDLMSYHELEYKHVDDVIFLTIAPKHGEDIEECNMRLYFLYSPSLKMYPSIENQSFYRDLPDQSDPHHPYRVRLDSSVLTEVGRYVYGILQTDVNGNVTSEMERTLTNYTLHNMATRCQFWNETTEKWETTGCQVGSETSNDKVICLCNHLTSFGSDFIVAPNPIDFSALGSKLANLKDNLAVLMTIIGLIVLYIIGVVACRRQDKKDVQKWSVGLLMDNNISDGYFYQITVLTGSRREAETSSRIFFIVSGEYNATPLRILADKKNTKFDRGSERKFMMSTERPLGDLSFIKIWHDNSGKDSQASWYLDHICITDLQTQNRYYFMCDDWLAVDQSDGRIERTLPVAVDSQIADFRRVFASSTKKDFSDGHLWFSLISRPTKSNFTRVQRLTCALAVLFSTMLTSAMFFGAGEENANEGALEIGPIKITVKQIIISIEASLIVLPVNILLVQLFRRSRSKQVNEDDGEDIGTFISKSVATIEEEIDEKEGKKGGKGFQFPYWTVYVAWVLAFVIAAPSATFVFLYSVDWGAEKSNEWLLSIVMSFFQSIFVIQPGKVILTAIALSIFINRCARDRATEIVGGMDEEERNQDDMEAYKKNEEEWLLQTPLDDEMEELRSQEVNANSSDLEAARKKRLQHKIMLNTVHEIVSYLLYIILLTAAANASKDIQAYPFHRSLSDVFLATGEPVFEEIRTPTDFWAWCDNGLIDGLHAQSWYNNKRITWLQSRFISNRETFVIGTARIRQLRVKHDACVIEDSPILASRDCISDYNILTQDTQDFAPGWELKSKNSTTTIDPWTYQSFLDLGGFPYNGLKNLYDGGGYAFTLKNTANSSRNKLETLKNLTWIDRHTAAIFVEFTIIRYGNFPDFTFQKQEAVPSPNFIDVECRVYNANVNLFAAVVLLLEKSPNGAFFGNPVITPIRLYDFIDGLGTFLIAIYVLFVIIFVYNLQNMVRKIIAEKKKYFDSFWNVIDFVTAILSLLAIAVYGGRAVHSNSTLNKITADVTKENFVNFQYIVLWDELFRFSNAFTLFLASIKMSKLLQFNRRIRILSRTLGHAAKPALYFSAMFGLYFFAYIILAHVWFEQKMYTFSSVYLAAEELFSMLLGRFDFTELKAADRVLGPLFFIAFTGCLTFTLLNMFIVILDESIKKARAEMEAEENEFEVVEYMMTRLTATLQSFLPSALLPKKKVDADDELGPVYIEYPEEVLELRVTALAERVSKMEVEFFSSFTLKELEAELELIDDDDDDDIIDVPSLR